MRAEMHLSGFPKFSDPPSSIKINDMDISGAVSGMRLTANVDGFPVLELQLALFETVDVYTEETTVHLAPGVEEALKALGWRPPGELE